MNDTLIITGIAWLFIVISAGMLINHNQYKKLLESFLGNRSLVFLSAIVAFFVGFYLVNTHNTWDISWQNSVVSGLGWIVLVKSIAMLVFPGFVAEVTHIINYQKHLTIIASVLGIVGIALIFFVK